MEVKKTISTMLLSCLFINNVVSSFAGALSDDGRYETFEGSNITVNDILEEDKVDVKIEGNTLVNLADIESEFKIRNSNTYYRDFTICEVSKLKANTDYTFFIYKELLGNHNQNYNIFEIGLANQLNDTNTHPEMTINNGVGYSYYFDKNKTKEIIKIKVNFKNFKECKYLSVRPSRRYSVPVSTEYCNADVRIVLLEGDYTDKNIEYFEGIQSSFENQLITQEMINDGEEKAENLGKYKVEVKSTGKNKLSGTGSASTPDDVFSFIEDSNGIITATNTVRDNRAWKYENSQYFVNLTPGTYTISVEIVKVPTINYSQVQLFLPSGSSIWTYSYNSIVSSGVGGKRSYTFTVNDYTTIGIIAKIYDGAFKIQVEEGAVPTECEPYKESVNTFYLNSPLLQEDAIEVRNGQAYHVKRCREIVFDGSDDEDWRNRTSNFPSENTSLFAYEVDNFKYGNALCDSFVIINVATELDKDGFMTSVNGDGYAVYIRISKSKLSIDDVGGFKEWLKNNPVKVAYNLSEPIYEPIKADLSIQLFKGTTHIWNNSNIPATMEITVDRVLNRATEAVELAKTSSTTENISRARMWTNLLKESIFKDQLQNEINSITEIEDLKLEKKTVTSNMDLYVKSENMLSMTLSTNFITFDNYGGAEDIEKLDALEISINSSLPYSLNSYLVSEIQNNDGSSMIDRELFNIRESSQGEYKKFINIGEKVVLKDDCEAGNSVIHNIDMKLEGSNAHKADIYKTVIKFEAEQK